MKNINNDTKKQPGAKPLTKKEDVQKNPDQHIDQDFPGYPHPMAKEELINPRTPADKETADVHKKTGKPSAKQQDEVDESQSDGSANAFEETESDAPFKKRDHKGEDY